METKDGYGRATDRRGKLVSRIQAVGLGPEERRKRGTVAHGDGKL